ncbi:glycoside hydrolase family 13 protein [Planococcus salinus]|uniref:oligo-1,6-glucosidase n=1 Tax=Planococcus salinus TaxID=1848460 RepID=A0A3M8P5U7_9BACL|nr:alpha-glucosidase [Planococcus salinus]RNF39053.1 alpha-glucosidase [Planococcus salinus]
MKEWWKNAVVYQIYPRSFKDSNGDGIGDLQGIIQKLDYLEELGIDVIWLSPVYDSPNDDNGYDVRHYHKIMKEFGTMDDFDELLENVHKKGMRLIMDLVVNHTSDEHDWFRSRPDMYIWRDKPNNWRSFFGGSAWQYDEARGQYYLHLFSKKQPDLNWEKEGVRQAIYAMMRWWLDKGIDGFRMDVINMLSKDQRFPDGPAGDGTAYFINGPKIHHYLKEMNDEVLCHYDIVTVGETPQTGPEEGLRYTSPESRELNMIFTFEHMGVDQELGNKWQPRTYSLVELRKILEKWQSAFQEKGWNSLYWNNHDQPRSVSRFGDDHVYRVESAKMLATCLFFMRGTPFIYQGEELGMTNIQYEGIEKYKDIETLNHYHEQRKQGRSHEKIMQEIYRRGRDNARTPMQWTSGPNAGFTTGVPWIDINSNYRSINTESRHHPQSIFAYYQALISLRKKLPVLIAGDFMLFHKEDEEVFAYERKTETEHLIVYCNFSTNTRSFEQPDGEVLIGNYSKPARGKRLTLRPYEALVFYRQSET